MAPRRDPDFDICNSTFAGRQERGAPQSELSFEFHSPTASNESLIVSVMADNSLATDTWPGGEKTIVPLNTADLVLDSPDVWRVGQSNGGDDFIRRYQDEEPSLSMQLKTWPDLKEKGALWYVLYLRMGVPGKALSFLIDPRTGAIVEKKSD